MTSLCLAMELLVKIRMRIRAEGGATIPPNLNSGNHSNAFQYGETEDFTGTYAVPSGLSADFLLPDSVFIGTQAVLTKCKSIWLH